MVKLLAAASIYLAFIISAHSNEYCLDQYEGQISNVNSELATILRRQDKIDTRIAEIYIRITQLSSEMSAAATKNPPDLDELQKLGPQVAANNREKSELETEGFKLHDRVVALKGVIPADLQGKLRGCIEASAPANKLVNLTIQSLAILSTGGLSLLLPPKALYVDMSAVLNGYPTGGPHSVINEARESALRALPGGLGNPRNDFGKFVRDPGRLIRCPFGGC